MSKAREIAEERFAKGEISEQEFDLLIAKLSNNKSQTTGSVTNERSENASKTSIEEEVEQRMATKANQDFISASNQNNSLDLSFLQWPAIIVFLYLAYSTYVWSQFNPYEYRNEAMSMCRVNEKYCNCQADYFVRQMGFFKAPLVVFGIIELKPMRTCGHLM